LAAAAGDPQLSLDLYEWNAEISSALLSYDIAGRVTDAVNVATLIDAELGQHLAATSQVGLLLVQRAR